MEQPSPPARLGISFRGYFLQLKAEGEEKKLILPGFFSARLSLLAPAHATPIATQMQLNDPSALIHLQGPLSLKDAPWGSVTCPGKRPPQVLRDTMPSHTVLFQLLLNYFEN